jgi:CBS domain containing-hemolysin-like protein
MSLIIILIILSTTTSFCCSLLEAVILSTTHAHIAVELKKGRRYAQILEHLKNNVNRPISAILTINTIANTAGGAAVGAQVQRLYGEKFLSLFAAITTVVILVCGEIIPKILGATFWKRLAPASAYILRGLIVVVYPFVWLAEHLAKALGGSDESMVSREEVIVTAEMGADEGSIRPKESAIIKNLLMLDNMKVSDIMTPRAVMYAFESGTTVGEIMSKHKPVRFSRIPVFRNDLDHILGVVHRYKILEEVSHDRDAVTVDQLMTPIHSIPENISVAAALDQFIKRHEHIFVVIDDYGSTTGIVSLEDAIETLLGVEIVDEFDSVADLRQLALEQWRDRKQKLQNVK